MNKTARRIILKFLFFSLVLSAIFSSGFILGSYFGKDLNPNPNSVKLAQQVKKTTNDETQDVYTERGSPLDRRIVGGKVIFNGPRDKNRIALTFDAEMTDNMRAAVVSGKVKSSFDSKIIDVLNQTQTKATLFLTGQWIELYTDVTKQLSKNPLFEFGSHSYNDSSYNGYCYGLTQIPDTLDVENVGSAEKLLREYAGIDNRLFRFPGGCYSQHDIDVVNLANDTVIQWDVVGADGFNNNSAQIVSNVVNNTQNGSIIILHINGAPTAPKTAEALPEIISKLKAKGFEFVKISELLGLQPAPHVSN